MEKLKSVIPSTLKRIISESTPDDLPSTCSSLLDFFHQLPHFHQIVRDLTEIETALCCKNKDAALESKRKGNDCFSKGDYRNALRFYSQALRVAPTDADEMGKNLVATLYVNRAAVSHKIGLLVECQRDCNRALVISPSYAKAWYRRGKANASSGNYEDAVRDLNVAMNKEPSLGGKRQIQSELNLILDQHKGTGSCPHKANENNLDFINELDHIKLQCISTPTKGRGMVSLTDIPQASLIHTEEPYAAVILKHCRETHCHFCLNELPADTVPCSACSIPLYCSQQCQVHAGGQKMGSDPKNHDIDVNLSGDLDKSMADISLASVSGLYTERLAEHRHECQGVHWPAVLPSVIVLAGRVLVKSIEQLRHTGAVSSLIGNLELCHNYLQMPSDCKLELHIQSIILLYCLRHPYGSEFQMNGVTISQAHGPPPLMCSLVSRMSNLGACRKKQQELHRQINLYKDKQFHFIGPKFVSNRSTRTKPETCVILLSQIKVNSMAITRMKSLDLNTPVDQSGMLSSAGDAVISTVEQIRVAQAIYLAGSLFNHSCQPNIHAYFLSRTLYIRSTEFVAAGYPLELSYGPQVGQWDCKDRQQFLEDQYSFRCQCSGCSELNLSDLVLNAFRCLKPNCLGVVLDSCAAIYEKQKVNLFLHAPAIDSSEPHLRVNKLKMDDINTVACRLFEERGCSHQFEPGYCMNCGSYRDLETSTATVNKASVYIRRLEDGIVSNEFPTNTLSDALRSLDVLRSTLHAYNKKIAEVEDNLAQAFCLVGELQSARDHCKASIEIVEKLYDPNHIVIGDELVKLTSIQLSLGDCAAADSINRAVTIFSRYYGLHVNSIYPHLQCRDKQPSKLVQ